MIIADELRHLGSGPHPGQRPGGIGLVTLRATATDPAATLDRTKEVLRTVLTPGEHGWRTAEEWADELPCWFVDRCAPESPAGQRSEWLTWWRNLDPSGRSEAAERQAWSLDDWLFWLQPEERTWYWWDSRIAGPRAVEIILDVPGWPAPTGALSWLLKTAGADDVVLPELVGEV